jgi:hypothetical protein
VIIAASILSPKADLKVGTTGKQSENPTEIMGSITLKGFR